MLVENRRLNKKEIIIVGSSHVAGTFEKEHKEVIRAIEGQKDANGKTKHIGLIEQLQQGGELHLENYFILSEYIGENGRKYKEYLMTRDGFTLLAMGFTGEKAMRFKLAYIKQFNAMEELLKGKLIEREKGIAVRQSLTKAIQQSKENERMHGHAYSIYSNYIYKVLFGMNAKQLREKYGIETKENLRDYFSEEELKAVQSMECLVSGLIDCGWSYDMIKEFIEKNNSRCLVA